MHALPGPNRPGPVVSRTASACRFGCRFGPYALGGAKGDTVEKCPAIAPLNEDKLVIVEARHESGATLKAIASDLGISRQPLAYQLRKRGLKLRGRAPEPNHVDEMRRRYETGDSLETVGIRLGFSAGTVRTWLIDSRGAMRDTHGRAK